MFFRHEVEKFYLVYTPLMHGIEGIQLLWMSNEVWHFIFIRFPLTAPSGGFSASSVACDSGMLITHVSKAIPASNKYLLLMFFIFATITT